MTLPRTLATSADNASSLDAWPFIGTPNELVQLTEEQLRALARHTPWRVLAIGARLRSLDAADTLASEATGGTQNWASLREWLDRGDDLAPHSSWDMTRIAVAALIAAVLEPGTESFGRVVQLLRRHRDRVRLDVQYAEPALRLATQIAVHEGARDVFDWARSHKNAETGIIWAGEVDFMGPATPGWHSALMLLAKTGTLTPAMAAWWRACNEPVVAIGVEPFELDLAHLGSLDVDNIFAAFRAPKVPRLSLETLVPSARGIEAAALTVSVIVPTYNPTESFLATIESLLGQSWPHLEVLVVDDCSSEGLEFLEQADALDPRVRVIRQSENGGAYRARNRGLAEARGAFITFQDADDLSHSRRIERQMLPLLTDAQLMATTSRTQRVRTDGALTFFGYLAHRINDSSLLFRKDKVLERLGGFDGVRKGADSEFQERLQAAFGDASVLALDDVLSFVQLTTGSLSRSDFRYGWMSGSRASYFHQIRAAHARIAASPEQDWLLTPERPHISWSDAALRGEERATHVTTAVLGDWKARVERPSGLATLVRSVAESTNDPVALFTGIRPRFSTVQRDGVASEVAELVEIGAAVWGNWADPVHIGTLVVPDPEYLLYLPDAQASGVSVDRVVLLLDQPVPHVPASTSLPPLDWAEARVLQKFGVRAEWSSAAPGIDFYLNTHERAVVTHPFTSAHQPAHSTAHGDRRPALGIALPVPADKARPSLESLERLLREVQVEEAQVVLYDELGFLESIDWDATSITVLHGSEHSRADFLARVDVLLLDPFEVQLLSSPSWIDLAQRTGVPAIAPRAYAAAYGSRVRTYTRGGAGDLLAFHLIRAGRSYEPHALTGSPLAGQDPRF